MNKFQNILKGGDLRSIGKANDVVRMVNSQGDFDELFVGLRSADRKVVMRTADAMEKMQELEKSRVAAADPGFALWADSDFLDMNRLVRILFIKIKVMKQLLTFAVLLVFLSCGQKNKLHRGDLLTSSIWTIEKESMDGFSRMTDTYEFLTDGTCLLVTGDTEIHGKWSWAKDDEIYIKPEGAVVNGEKVNVDSYGICLRVVELNDKVFRTLEKVEVDSWTSGLLKERKYAASSL